MALHIAGNAVRPGTSPFIENLWNANQILLDQGIGSAVSQDLPQGFQGCVPEFRGNPVIDINTFAAICNEAGFLQFCQMGCFY